MDPLFLVSVAHSASSAFFFFWSLWGRRSPFSVSLSLAAAEEGAEILINVRVRGSLLFLALKAWSWRQALLFCN